MEFFQLADSSCHQERPVCAELMPIVLGRRLVRGEFGQCLCNLSQGETYSLSCGNDGQSPQGVAAKDALVAGSSFRGDEVSRFVIPHGRHRDTCPARNFTDRQHALGFGGAHVLMLSGPPLDLKLALASSMVRTRRPQTIPEMEVAQETARRGKCLQPISAHPFAARINPDALGWKVTAQESSDFKDIP